MTATHRTILPAAALALAAMFAPGITIDAKAAERRTVKSGGEVLLANYFMYQPVDCKPLKVTVKVVKPPMHGSLRQAAATADPLKAQATTAHFANCSGTPIRSTAFYYRAKNGFRGKDRVVLRLIGFEGGGTSHFDITVD